MTKAKSPCPPPRSRRNSPVKHQLGVGLQFFVLVALPMLIIWQLEFGFRLLYMPGLLLLGILIFAIGTQLRES